MSGFDLHPEELLDRVRRGRASVAERDQVRAHLRSCEACSFEHALLAESARDATPSAGDGERARRIAQAAVASLEAAGARAALGARAARAGATRASGGKAPRRVAALLAVAIVSSLATAAAAAVMTQPAWLMRILPAAIGGEPETAREEPAARRARKKPVRMATALKPEAAANLAPEPVAAEPVSVPTPEVEQAPEAATSTRATGARSAAELFAAANVARREGEVGKAARMYRELVRQHARAPEGLVARVTFGRLLLDRLGDARGALREFDAYLGDAKQGTLREEALIGRALALGKLGRAREERRAWTALLAAFPNTGYAERAKARATELRCADGSC